MTSKLTWPATPSLLPVALAICMAFPLSAQAADATTQELLQELRALKSRVNELEKKLEAQQTQQAQQAQQARPAQAASGEGGGSGMTPDQLQDFNRIAVKAEALEDARDMLGFKGLKVSGYMDPSFIYNQRRHQSGFQFLNSVKDGGYTYDNSYFGGAAIDFTKETDSGTRWRLTLVPQRSTQAVSEGSASILHEASVSVPLTDLQTRFIAGHIPDWSGYEYLQPTLNKLITHNLLFDLTLPTAYTGAGMEILSGKWWSKAVIANMNASKRGDNEKTPVLAYRVDYAKGEFQGFGFAGVHGRGSNFRQEGQTNPYTGLSYPTESRVDLFEFDAYFIRGDWTVQGQVSAGRQKNAAITLGADGELRDAMWTGFSGLVAYKFMPWFEGVARLDYINNRKNGGGLLTYATLDDHNGIGPAYTTYDPAAASDNWALIDPNKGVNRAALSLGLNYAFNLNTVFKFEYRFDWATGPIFLDTRTNEGKNTNQLLGTSVVVSF
ncbi:MAG: DUF3138 family protein [Aquabacterium sp.]